jgi:hypothetical protein
VEKLEPVSAGVEMDHAEEAGGQLVVTGGDGTVDLEGLDMRSMRLRCL